MKKLFTLLALSLITHASCNMPECKNTNPVFDKYQPSSAEYKEELAKQLAAAEPGSPRYWIDQYIVSGNDTFMSVFVQNKQICAVMMTKMTHWHKLENFKEKQGKSYSGAELDGFKYDIVKDSTGTHFIYRNLEKIID